MSDLGFANLEETPAEEVHPDEGDAVDALSWEVAIKNPDRYAGEDPTEDILSDFITPFQLEVMYGHIKPHRCDFYYHTPPDAPERKTFHSKRAIVLYFQDNPHNHLSNLSFDLHRKLLGLNNQRSCKSCPDDQV